MGNNGSCDVCMGNTRNQMDMRRSKNAMYERYAQGQRMSRTQADCDDCRRTGDELQGMPIAMAYVPWQNFECTYEPAQALRVGTIFPELDKPFLAYGRRGMR